MTITDTTTITPEAASPPLISADLRARLVARVQDDARTDRATAGRIIEDTIGFLGACALNPGARLVPSKLIDFGWHAFILHTREYAEFCERTAGRFIHHRPEVPGQAGTDSATIGATVAAIRAAGFPADADLWTCGANCSGKCSQCYAGCHDDPRAAC